MVADEKPTAGPQKFVCIVFIAEFFALFPCLIVKFSDLHDTLFLTSNKLLIE